MTIDVQSCVNVNVSVTKFSTNYSVWDAKIFRSLFSQLKFVIIKNWNLGVIHKSRQQLTNAPPLFFFPLRVALLHHYLLLTLSPSPSFILPSASPQTPLPRFLPFSDVICRRVPTCTQLFTTRRLNTDFVSSIVSRSQSDQTANYLDWGIKTFVWTILGTISRCLFRYTQPWSRNKVLPEIKLVRY